MDALTRCNILLSIMHRQWSLRDKELEVRRTVLYTPPCFSEFARKQNDLAFLRKVIVNASDAFIDDNLDKFQRYLTTNRLRTDPWN